MDFKYKTVLFDADGTLLDFKRSEREAFIETMAAFGFTVDDEAVNLYSRINDSLWKRLERKEIERSFLLRHRFELLCEHYGYSADTEKMSAEYIDIISQKGYMLTGAEELLDRLRGRVRMYVITNGAERVQRGRYARTGMEKYFDGIFVSEVIGFNKPDVRYFDFVRTHIEGFDPKTTLVVGDSLTSDIKGGNAAGLDTCWYDPERAGQRDVAFPTYTAYDFNEVYNIILGKEE